MKSLQLGLGLLDFVTTAGISFQTPAQLGADVWLSASLSTLKQNADGTGTTQTANNAPIGRISDLSGNNRHYALQPGTQPGILKTAGKPVIETDPSGTIYWNSGLGDYDFPTSGMLIAVVKALGVAGPLFSDTSNPGSTVTWDGANWVVSGGSGGTLSLAGSAGFVILTTIFNGASSSIQTNKNAPVTGSITPTASRLLSILGDDASDADYANMQIGDIVAFPNATNKNACIDYLNNFYQVF